MGLAKKTLKKVNESEKVKGMIADEFKKHIKTVQRWVDKNAPILTTAVALKIYESELGIKPEEALQNG